MSRIRNEIKQMLHPPLSSFPTPYYNIEYHESSSPSSSSVRISPLLLLIIVIFAVIFFLAGLLHLLFRFLIKRPSFSPIYDQSNRYTGNSESHGRLQRQLQQLFRLHDSGLDQSVIDALPVFHYKDIIMGLKEPFDCAVCLCEFLEHDKLRLLPLCGHAFHIDCIETWLLTNSTCPLCRATLSAGSGSGSSFPLENPMFQCEYLRVMSNGSGSSQKPAAAAAAAEDLGGKRVFSVRLGKFRSLNDGGISDGAGRVLQGEISSCNLDATTRRCYSMGAYQYVVGDSLQVSLSAAVRGDHKKLMEGNADVEDCKTIRRSKGESFSVSKIWLWSNKKSRFPASSDVYFNAGLPINGRTQAV